MAYLKIVDAMKLINTEEKLTSVDVPGPHDIITGHDARKNKTYQTTCITPPAYPEAEEIYGFAQTQQQYIPSNMNVPALRQISQAKQVPQLAGAALNVPPLPRPPTTIPNDASFGSCSNMPYTHFGQDIHSNSSSSGDELSASTNSGDRDTQNVSSDDGGMSREYSSSSAPNSLSIHIPEHIDNIGYGANNINNVNNNNYGLDQRQNMNISGYDKYQHGQYQQNIECPVLPTTPTLPTLAGVPATSSGDNIW
eukprot:CAMPEP_0201593854 /NCGR_PEP_ID=MMETSP0190_2-20130828/191351_1 /ASSEMBLY_ACC=CAM_ASM_000263 /TAXON_ID=37353 /ORGANISM="Rosalina sp." /LENGTH=251 /DNA_ID=CAMNT_0048053243 /DNA_START=937 /DNA_END=1689 /DNA_ORIENTATION=-